MTPSATPLSASSHNSNNPESLIKWGPVGKPTFERTYSRPLENGNGETWFETCERVAKGNCEFVDSRYIDEGEQKELESLMKSMKILPAGRHLWITGIKGKQFVQNCWSSPFPQSKPFSRHFTLLFDLTMQGGGVGSNYSNRYISHFGKVLNEVDLHFVCHEAHNDYEELREYLSEKYSVQWDGSHQVMDSREGWTKSLEILLDSYSLSGKRDFKEKEPANRVLVIDISQVRHKGSLIKGFGGTASGPLPLVLALKNVSQLLNKKKQSQEPINSLDCMSIDHEVVKCVISGGIRRSSRIGLKSWRDQDILDFITCKIPVEGSEEKPHWSANISVEVDNEFFRAIRNKRSKLHSHAITVHKAVCRAMLTNSEPGLANRSLASVGELSPVYVSNPCGEIYFNEQEDGDTVESCNLAQVNLAAYANNPEGAERAFKLLARFLIRATFCDVPDPVAKRILETNRRIGVGFTGYHGWCVKQGIKYSESHHSPKIKKLLRKFKKAVVDEARRYASQLRIPCPIKNTAIAPCGTISKLPGVTEGSNSMYAKYFERTVRYQDNDSNLDGLREAGNKIEKDVYSRNTEVVYFTCKDPLVDELIELGLNPDELLEDAFEVNVSDYLAVQAMIQEEYADNAVSFTVNIPKEHDYTEDNLGLILMNYMPRLKGMTLMVDDSYEQPPLRPISKEEYDAAQVKSVEQGEIGCANGVCPVK